MKTYALLSLVLVSAVATHAQGTVLFANLGATGSGLNAPVYQSDGVTRLSGSQFMAELLGGPSQSSLAQIATTGFLQGNGAGYFSGGTQSINTVVPGDLGLGPNRRLEHLLRCHLHSGQSFGPAELVVAIVGVQRSNRRWFSGSRARCVNRPRKLPRLPQRRSRTFCSKFRYFERGFGVLP